MTCMMPWFMPEKESKASKIEKQFNLNPVPISFDPASPRFR